MPKRWAIAWLLVGLAAAFPALLAETRDELSQPNKKWIRGPVKWIATPEEEKAFKSLKTEEEIAQFIKEFWARRDPSPGTPANEYEELFWKRVEQAEKNFPQTTDSGSFSDRGRVFILLGSPSSVNSAKNIEWIYKDVPHVEPSSFTILFRMVGVNPLLLGKKDFEELIDKNEFLRGLGPKAAEIYAPPPAVAEALPSAQEAAPQEAATEESKLLDSLAGSEILPTALPVQVQIDIYKATKGDSYVVVTLGVPRADAGGASLVGFARFVPKAADVKPVTLAAADSFAPAEPENGDAGIPWLVFQGGSGLHPGTYTLLAGVRDPQSGKAGVVKREMDVPSYGETGLSLSTVTLAQSLQRPDSLPAAAEGKKPPYFLGSFRVIPSLDDVFQQGSDLSWYYQIYNAKPDPASGQLNLTIEYDFLLKQVSKEHPEGEFREVTAPQIERNRPSQIAAFSFKLIRPHPGKKDGWVEGDYKLVIKVTDEVAKNTVSKEVPFRVVP